MSLGMPGHQQQGGEKNNLGYDMSSVDPNAILLRLAGKPAKKGEVSTSTNQKDKKKGKSNTKDRKRDSANDAKVVRNSKIPGTVVNNIKSKSKDLDKSATNVTAVSEPNVEASAIPDLYGEELDETALAAFRELFNTLDQSHTGIVTAENMYEELHRVDSQITFSDVEDVLKKVDKDGNGQIDFDEFLYHMTAMGGDLFGEGSDGDEEKRQMHSRRKRLFYSAITHFSIKQTLADIEKTFRKQAPHVISHYTAGVRLIGLTTRQLEREMKKMLKAAAKNDSPYAKPLMFVHLGMKGQQKFMERKKIQTKKDKTGSSRDLQQKELSEPEHDPAVDNLTKEIKDTMLMFAQKKGTIEIEDANIVMKLRQKLGSVTAWMQNKKAAESKENSHQGVSAMPILNKPKSAVLRTVEETPITHKPKAKSAPVEQSCKREKQKNFVKAQGWTTPRIQYIDVPLPSLKMQHTSEKLTFNNLYRIRAKATQAIDAYYHNLRQAEIRNAWDHWDRLYADVILPKKLVSNFKKVYAAYSPHREEEAFVLCPWKPGPFRILRHIQKPPVSCIPQSTDKAITGCTRQKSGGLKVTPRNKLSCQQTYSTGSPSFRQTPSPLGRPCSSLADTCASSSHSKTYL